jgi:phosphate transport system substrate-binding protein
VFKLRRTFVLVITAVAAAAVGGAGVAYAGGASGEILVSGSSTVEPITSLVAELYAGDNPNVQVSVDGPGTGDGFQLFCDGEIDIADASRPIEDEEVATCQTQGIAYTELPVAIDGLTLVANKSSKISCLDAAQIYGIFGPESTGSLADAQSLATELGSTNKKLPTGSVKKFTPGPESGTYDAFIDLTYADIMDERLAAGEIPGDKVDTNDDGEQEVTEPLVSDGQFPDDNNIVQRVEGSKDGIGFFGFAFYEQNKGELKELGVLNPESGKCVKPTRKTIQTGDYSASRLLYIYPDNAKAQRGAVKSFIDFFMTKRNLTTSVVEAGYVALPTAQRAASIEAWKSVG